jgi:hypothetical protein
MTAPRRSDGQQGFADVRYAFNGDRLCASQRTGAMPDSDIGRVLFDHI